MTNRKFFTKALFISSCLFVTSGLFAGEKDVLLSTPNTSLLLSAPQDQELKIVYYGDKIQPGEIDDVYNSGVALNRPAYPVFGVGCDAECALMVTHPDGNMSLEMVVADVSREEQPDAQLTTITMKDKVYPFEVKVVYKAYKKMDVIETWSEIVHQEKKPVTLNIFSSGYLPIRQGNVWMSHLHGTWGAEGTMTTEPLHPGMTVIKNKDGVRNSHTSHSEVMISLDGKPQENEGRIIGAALCWSGNYKLRLDTEGSRYHDFFAGINEEASAYRLEPKEVFTTPELALTYSKEGLSGASRNFHRWGRNTHIAHGNKTHDILLNSWEGVYFNVNQKVMDQMMGDIASMGGELFVMDDGWFGDKYKRNIDTAALGDWVVDKAKLPGGIADLVAAAKKHNVKFGIWIEPEMTNIYSELYEKHPDWIVCPPNRTAKPGRGRTQLVLDLSNPKVQDFIFGVVDNLMTENPEIAYIKWDANMNIINYGSSFLTGDKQSHLYIDFHRGFEKVCQRIRAKYPDLAIQACASGGGRANYGVMPYFDEFWVSDNTDALQRIYMQWGTSYFFPAVAMASHVSAAPNHQTGRILPLKFHFDVAMTGRLGMEIQPKNMTDDEKAFAKKAIASYKEIRPVIQMGDLYRLISPYDKKGVASLMYCSPEKEKAVFFAYKLEHFVNQVVPRFRMAGLDPNKKYRIEELNRTGNRPLSVEGKSFSGSFLMNEGIELYLMREYASCVLKLTEVR